MNQKSRAQMKTDIWMPLFIGEYMQQTLHLSRAEHGSYLLLLMAYWTNGGSLRDDDEALMNICRCPPGDWPRLKSILARFFTLQSGVWTHERLDKELRKAAALSAVRRQSGAGGAARRWQKHGKGIGSAIEPAEQSNGNRMAIAMANAIPEPSEGIENGKSLAKGMANAKLELSLEPSPLPLHSRERERSEAAFEGPPISREVYEALARRNGVPQECYDWYWNACEGRGWLDTHGQPIRKVEPLLMNAYAGWRAKNARSKAPESSPAEMTNAELLRHAQG